jgi:hypothetical protein
VVARGGGAVFTLCSSVAGETRARVAACLGVVPRWVAMFFGQGRRDLTGSKAHVNWCVTARTSCVGDWTSRALGRVFDGVADNANVDVG